MSSEHKGRLGPALVWHQGERLLCQIGHGLDEQWVIVPTWGIFDRGCQCSDLLACSCNVPLVSVSPCFTLLGGQDEPQDMLDPIRGHLC